MTDPVRPPHHAKNSPARLWVGGGLVVALLLAPAGCRSDPVATEGPTAPQRGGTLVIGSTADVDSWNPYVSRQAFANDVLRRILLPLATELPATQTGPAFGPRLAESWSASADETALTFRLREAAWSDGTPITAEDVRFSWTAQTSPEFTWADVGRKARIRDVVVVDPRTVRFEFDAPYPGQLADAVEGLILPRHRFSEIPFEAWATHSWTDLAIASGPFVLNRHEPGDQIVLNRNARYAGAAPWVDQIVVRVIPDMANLVTQLRSGQVDYVEGIPPRDAAALDQDPQITLLAFDQPAYDYVGWNGARPPLDDPELRRALTLAIDRQGLIDDMLYGYGRVSNGPLVSSWGTAYRALAPWPYDLDEARRILQAKGYSVNDGQRVTEGRELALTLVTNHGNDLRQRMLVKIQDDLKQLGVKVAIQSLEMQAMRRQIGSGDYDGYLGGWVYSPGDLASVFHSSSLFPQGSNMVGYKSADADAALDRANAAASPAEQVAALIEFQRRVHLDQPYTFLYEKQRLAAHGPRVQGLRIDVPADSLHALESLWLH